MLCDSYMKPMKGVNIMLVNHKQFETFNAPIFDRSEMCAHTKILLLTAAATSGLVVLTLLTRLLT